MHVMASRQQPGSPAHGKCAIRAASRYSPLAVLSLLGLVVILACTRCGFANASVINDVNNMLRDNSDSAHTVGVVATQTDIDPDTDINGSRSSGGGDFDQLQQQQKQKEQQRPQQHLGGQQRDVDMLRNSAHRSGRDGQSFSNYLSDETSVELLRFVNDNDDDNGNDGRHFNDDGFMGDDASSSRSNTSPPPPTTMTTTKATAKTQIDLSGNDDEFVGSDEMFDVDLDERGLQRQVRLLSKQLNALMTRRREDYELLEHNLRKSLRITTNAATVDLDIRHELEQLRHEVKLLRDGHLNGGNKERLTVEWLQQSVSELRKQLVELQQMANSVAKDVNRRVQSYEDLTTIRSDYHQLQLELVALKERQQQNEVFVRELREEVLQQEEDFKRLLHNKHAASAATVDESNEKTPNNDGSSTQLKTETLADHQRRHSRIQQQQIHELQVAQHGLKRQLNELKYHRIGERVRSIEIEQHRIADANFNLSRQIASLDKLHSSMLELLEDVEELQNKMDKSVPDLRHEISKLEFTSAQLTSEQSLLREEGKNVARSVQAISVSVSTLQEERDGIKQTQVSVSQLQTNVDRLQSMLQDVQRALRHHHHKSVDKKSVLSPHHNHKNANNSNSNATTNNFVVTPMTQRAESLVAKLEYVEEQYESIIDKLPQDCSEVTSSNDGLYMIAPAGQHRPLMAHCTSDRWTTVQRRFDGSADFNRSWEDYATGFGAPTGEYWIGNEQLHHLTLNNCTSLRVVMQDIYDNVWLAEYTNFYISSRADGYRLHVGGYSGNASDALDYQQGMQFSAIDVDRDISQTHCAANYEGGWWFSHCQHANLNGRYNLGLTWFDAARNEWIAVKSSHMLTKRQSAAACSYANGATPLSTPSSQAATSTIASTSSKRYNEAEATTSFASAITTPVADAPV